MIKRVRSWWNGADKQETLTISEDNIPQHVAIIMDGNGRWAKRLGLPRIAGHQNGMKAVKRATIAADELGIKYLTMYAFRQKTGRVQKKKWIFDETSARVFSY